MKFLCFLLRCPGNRVFAPAVDSLAHTAGTAFALIILRGIAGSNARRKFALVHPLIPRPLAYFSIMQLTTRRKTLQSP